VFDLFGLIVKVWSLDLAHLTEKLTLEALRSGTHYQRISLFCLHSTPACLPTNRMNCTCLCLPSRSWAGPILMYPYFNALKLNLQLRDCLGDKRVKETFMLLMCRLEAVVSGHGGHSRYRRYCWFFVT